MRLLIYILKYKESMAKLNCWGKVTSRVLKNGLLRLLIVETQCLRWRVRWKGRKISMKVMITRYQGRDRVCLSRIMGFRRKELNPY
jgi:hypothetical protein